MPFAMRSVAVSLLIAAAPLATSAATTLGTQDQMFATKAAQAGMAEVQLANLALEKSKTAGVLSFAREMKADHSKANAQLMSIIKAKSMMAPQSISAQDQALMVKLQSASGAAFDKLYLTSQLPAHKKVLALFQTEASSGQDSDLIGFAKMTIPVIASHIAMDKQDISKVASTGM